MQRRLGLDLEIPDDFGHWLAGFTDGEGHFAARISEKRTWRIPRLSFTIRLRADDEPIINQIRDTLQVGRIYYHPTRRTGKPGVEYSVYRIGDLYHVIVPLFEKYPLRAKKAADFEIWKEIVTLYYHARHNRPRGGGGGSEPLPQTFWDKIEPLMERLKEVRKYKQGQPHGFFAP